MAVCAFYAEGRQANLALTAEVQSGIQRRSLSDSRIRNQEIRLLALPFGVMLVTTWCARC
ncbi:hypothetical protein PSAB6_30359 [Paraburkholderia sabiae]|nr:hypothetical protein PSAB6_30359 [Paraburkholderia sabiae]